METKATIKSVKYKGLKYKIKVKAKGIATRIVRKSHIKDEETGEVREVTSFTDNEYVKKISYKVKDDETGDTVDKFKIKGLTKNELKWKCGAFKATKEGGFFFPGPTEITTEGPVDPGFLPDHGAHLRHRVFARRDQARLQAQVVGLPGIHGGLIITRAMRTPRLVVWGAYVTVTFEAASVRPFFRRRRNGFVMYGV